MIRNERYRIETPKVREIALEFQELVRAYGEKIGSLRRKNDDGNVRNIRRPQIRWLDRMRVILIEKELSTELHNPSNIDSQNSGPKMKSILTDEDDVP